MKILTTVWGENHIELFKKTALKSLAWPENKQALTGAKWTICTDQRFFTPLRELITDLFDVQLEFKDTTDLRDYIDPIQSAILKTIGECLDEKEKLLLVPPDTYFGETSIPHLINLGSDPDSVVVVPHVRVLPSIIDDIADAEVLYNDGLVTRAFQHLHQSWSDAERGHVRQNGYVGGVVWARVAPSILSVIHRLPTPYYMQFTGEDLTYFKSQISFGGFDHLWPGDILLKRGRMRYCASSDLCFMAEVTEKNKNVPPIWPGDPNSFWRQNFHNEINKQIIATFRGKL